MAASPLLSGRAFLLSITSLQYRVVPIFAQRDLAQKSAADFEGKERSLTKAAAFFFTKNDAFPHTPSYMKRVDRRRSTRPVASEGF